MKIILLELDAKYKRWLEKESKIIAIAFEKTNV